MTDTNWAFAQYETVRGRLPAPAFPASSQRVDNLGALKDRFDVFLLDAFGVLNVGFTPVPGAPAQIKALQDAGKKVMVLTNGASFPAHDSLKKYQRFGYEFAQEDVISSREILKADLATFPPLRWGAMAPDGAEVEELGADVTVLGDTQNLYDSVDGFLLVGSQNWTDAHQEKLVKSLNAHKRPVLVGNPDLVAPFESGFSLEPGLFAHRVMNETGIEPRFSGKPFGGIYAEAKKRYGAVPNERVLMVGDTLHTDIIGGAAAGIKTLLIEDHGLFRGTPTAPYIKKSGIAPDFIAATV